MEIGVMRRISRWTREVRLVAVIAAASLTLGACSDKTSPRVATTITAVSGNNQTIAEGAQITSPLIVSVLDQNGVEMSGVTVTWAVASGEGTLAVTTTTTDDTGQSTNTSFSSGADAGSTVVTATVGSLTPISFTLIVAAPADSGGM